MKKRKFYFILAIFNILLTNLFSQSSNRAYPDSAIADTLILVNQNSAAFGSCSDTIKCGDNFICDGEFENVTNPRNYAPFIPQWESNRPSRVDNSPDFYYRSGGNIILDHWPYSLAGKETITGGWPLVGIGAGPCGVTPSTITAPQGNGFMGMIGRIRRPPGQLSFSYAEAVYFNLRKALTPGKKYILKFYARIPPKYNASCKDINLEIRASTMPPCPLTGSNPITPLWNPSASWNSPCGYQYSQLISSPIITNTTSWAEFTLTFTASASIKHLILAIPQFDSVCNECVPYGYFDDFRLYDNDTFKLASKAIVPCRNTGSIYLTPQGGTLPYTYKWSDGATTKDRIGVNLGFYKVTITDSIGCTIKDSFLLSKNPDSITVVDSLILRPICTTSNGAIYISPTGGRKPYSYIWSNNTTNKNLVNVSAGYYKLIIQDSFGCKSDTFRYILVTKFDTIKVNKTYSQPPCARGTGSISLNPFNGSAPYTYIWAASAQTTNTRTNLAQGTYLVTITDNNGCFRRDTSLIKSLNSPLAISVTTHSYNCATNTISLQASVSGGVPFSYPYYQLLWSNGATNANPSNVSVVTYPNMKLVVTDAVGCKDSVIAPTNNWINIGTGTMYPNATSFTNTSVLTGKVRLYGTFTVNKQFSFVDAEIAANTASKIVVNKTSQNKPISLSSKNSRFYSCTDKLWKGIEIGDSCHIAMTNSTIEDALYGLELKNRAKKEINSNTFKNNFIAIFQTPTTSNHIIQSSDYDRDIWFNDIINNTFTGKGTGYIKPAPAGIALHGSHSAQHPLIYTHAQAWAALELNNAPYVDYFYNNKINQMANGVLTNNCHRVNLSGSNFSQIYPTNFPYPQSPLYQGICIFNMDLGNKPSRINNTSLPPTISSLDVNGYTASSVTNGVTTIGSATRFFDSHWGIFSFKGDIVARKLSFQNMNSIGGGNMLNQVWYNDNTATACKSGAAFHQNTSYDLNVNNNVFQITGFDTSSGALSIYRTAGINKLWFTASSISKNNINLLNTTGCGIRTHNYQRVNNNLNGTIENKVQDNYINLSRPDKALAGIQYNNSHIAELRNEVNSSFPNSRTIINNMRKPIGTYPVGIHYNETQGAFSCNKTYNLRTGMLYSLNCKNARMSKCKFFNNTTGLKLDNTSSVRSDTSNGNTWLGAWTGTGIRAAENLQSPINTWFLVRVTAPSIFWPSPRFPSSFFRNNPRTGSENDFCLNGGSGIGIGQEWYAQATPVSFLDLSINQQIIDGSLSYDVYDPELVYQGEQMLLEELYNIEDLLADSSDAHDFLIAHDTTNMGRFLRIKKDERDAFEPTASEKTSAQGLKAAIDLVQTRRWELDSILYTLHDTTPPPIITDTAYEPDTTLAAPNGYVLEYQVLTYSLDSLQYHMFLLDSAINTRAFPIMDTLWVRNAAIEPANTTETLQKLFNSVHYKTHAKRIGDLSPEQLATYRYLAQQCPALNADVVYKSRAAILPYDGNIDYQDYDTCFSVGIEYKSTKQPRNVAQKEIKKPNIQLYPNPAKESIFVRFSVIPETEISILVTDIQGKIVYKEPIMLNSNIISIQTSDWIEGVYIISIREGKNNLMESKFTIEK